MSLALHLSALRAAVLAAFLLLPALASAPESLLVLPFANLSGDKRMDWAGEAMCEVLEEYLAAEGLSIVAPELRDQAMEELGLLRYAGITRATAMEAAAAAGASLVLYGSFDLKPRGAAAQSGMLIRVDAHLLDVSRLSRRGAYLLEQPLERLSAVQASLAWQILRALRPEALVSEQQFQSLHPELPVAALENYALGLRAKNPEIRHKYFAAAARIAPEFSLVNYRLGQLNFFVFRNDPGAASWFEKVPERSPYYRPSLFYLGICRYRTGEFAAAAEALRKLAVLAPLPEVLNNLGAALLRLNDGAALETLASAAEANPSDPDIAFNLGYALWRAGRFDEAAEALRRSLQAKEDSTATTLLGRCLQRQGPRPGELRLEGRERIKTEYREEAWLALRSLVEKP
ncbi:MAG: tetratricopeptide repeat protein [Bryobacteraceae bacterium]|jgi:tetratricopeptide (TPR) repeat protein